jgi:hypothetical protein
LINKKGFFGRESFWTRSPSLAEFKPNTKDFRYAPRDLNSFDPRPLRRDFCFATRVREEIPTGRTAPGPGWRYHHQAAARQLDNPTSGPDSR